MARFVIRVWLPDRPGALGRVASAIGSVGASLIGIDILEQDGGYAIDELIVDAVDAANASEKLVVALTFVEGVNVEDIRMIDEPQTVDPRLDALESAIELIEQNKAPALLESLVLRARQDLSANWCVVIGFNDDAPTASIGDVPSTPWIKAFIAGSRSSDALTTGHHHGADDIAWSELLHAESALVVGRIGRAFRARERNQLAALARIADRRLTELPH